MVVGNKLIELFYGFFIFLILVIIFGLGLGFGWWFLMSII